MDNAVAYHEAPAALVRAGCWRRWLAILIDWIILAVPFQLLAVILFSLTAGHIQMNNSFYSHCEPIKTIPQGLTPSPPHDSNFASVCDQSLFGARTGTTLNVGRITREGSTTTTVSQGYMLDADRNPVSGTLIDWIVVLAFIGYLVGMTHKTGRTLGARVVKVRVVDAANPQKPGVPLGRTIVRYLATAIGWIPAFTLLIYLNIAGGGSADAMFTAGTLQGSLFTVLLGVAWGIVLTVQIAQKRDPVYDRLAGTAVLRDLPA